MDVQVTDNQPLHLDDSLQVNSDNLLRKMLFHFLLMFKSGFLTVVPSKQHLVRFS